MPINVAEHGAIGNATETDGTVSFNGIKSTVTISEYTGVLDDDDQTTAVKPKVVSVYSDMGLDIVWASLSR